MRESDYEHSDLVFQGELIHIDTLEDTYTFKVIEVYKGRIERKEIKGKYFNSCSLSPEEKTTWIVYSDLQENGMIDISICSASRSKTNPICFLCYKPPAPLKIDPNPEEIREYEKYVETFRLERMKKAKIDWEEEIDWLRAKKN